MEKKVAFNALVSLLKDSTLSEDDGYLCVTFPNSIAMNNDKITTLMQDCGYCTNSHSITDDKLYINRASHVWLGGTCPIYLDHKHFWQQIQSATELPENFFIANDKTSSCDDVPTRSIRIYSTFFIWKKLISKIADHIQINRAIIFITTDNSVKKLDIPLSVENSELQLIENPDECLSEITKLYSLIEVIDPHSKERVSVLRTALSEAANKISNNNLLFELINKTVYITRKYDELYDIYTRRFSVNKLLNELDEKSLEFTSKINEYISSSQNKALTIPGALIAIGALVKSGGILESLIIFFGLWLIKSVTKTANDIYRESFESLDKRLDNAFRKYLKFDEGKEVRESAVCIETELREQFKNAKLRLNKIDTWAIYMLIGGGIYLSFSSYKHITAEYISTLKEIMNFFEGLSKEIFASIKSLANFLISVICL
ncbi:hypothetical protein [Serratia oryzae]|uniref:hypothetical protein n=1 Tax=Serratia oryzae TaxID=2034155 RepID=UPI0012E1CB8E|nr:hypothetical protein [Serratia oryzae]